jgi:uncharacterized protein
MSFVNRQRELRQLDAILQENRPRFVVVYGRRRIGKTRLLTHWMDQCVPDEHAYWVAHRTSSDVLLRGFSEAVARLLPAQTTGIVFSDWAAALRQLFALSRHRRLIVAFDEFPYLVESVPEFPSLLQKLWDQESPGTRIALVLCGSHYRMMQDQFLSPRQPLYGRATAVIRLEEIGPGDLLEFLPRYSAQQVVETYSVIGGVPKYLELWDDRAPVLRNVQRLILSPASLFRHEALMLIHDEIAEPRTYLAILECLGAGLKTPAELARQTGIAINHIGKYLHMLVELRLVRRVLSEDVPDRKRSRTGRYEIRDPFLRFYFHFVYPYPELVEQNRTERLAEIIRSGFDSYVGRTGYEELARSTIAQAGDNGELPFEPLYVGRAWHRQVEIDLLAISRKQKAVLLGECKWHKARMGPEVLAGLRERSERLKHIEGFKKHYVLFSRSGFTKRLEQQALQEGVLLFEGADFKRLA